MHNQFKALYGEKVFENIGSDEVYGFLENLTQGLAKSTRRLRYAQLKAFFNFVINRCDLGIKNPCNTSLLSKTFRTPKQSPRKVPDKEALDEIIYNTKNLRESDIIARIGGDEFVILAMNSYETSSEKLINRFELVLKNHHLQTKRPYTLSLSLGIAYFDPQDPCSIDVLLAQADKVMYENKQKNSG